jgi:hypothetical protein
MTRFREPQELKTHCRQLGELLVIGGAQLEALAKESGQITFQKWSEVVRKAASHLDVEDEQLKWLWEALTTEPTVYRAFRSQILSHEEEWKRKPQVTVLGAGHSLGIFLKGLSMFGAPVLAVSGNARPDAIITLHGPLTMGPGKAGRFECRDVKASIEIRVNRPCSAEQETILMKLEPGDIIVKGETLTASVRSLNHAFTVTSRRLQPHRRSHGGRIYDHIAWRKDNNSWIRLEDIRQAVEAGRWMP